MSNRYPFSENDSYKTENVLDSAVLVEDGVVWDQEEVQVSLNYTADPDDTLVENPSESYLTANEGSNDTHYFSVLETTNETILNNLSDIAVNSNDADVDATEVAEEQPTIGSICTIGGQPDIFRIEGCDDLHAFEVAFDEEGNMQRFRYRLRLNENGEYESVPESIELLPLENEAEDESSHASPAEIPEQEHEGDEIQPIIKVLVKQEFPQEQETILPDIPSVADIANAAEDSNDELRVNEDEAEASDGEQFERNTETKAGIVNRSLLSVRKVESGTTYKSEIFKETLFQNSHHEDVSFVPNDNLHATVSNVELRPTARKGNEALTNFKQVCPIPNEANSDIIHTAATAEHEEHGGTSFEQILLGDTHETEDAKAASSASNIVRTEKLFIPEPDDNSGDDAESTHSEESEEHFENRSGNNLPYLEDLNENESDTDDYQIVDGVHVTADTESHEDNSHVMKHFLQREPSLQHQILKIQQQIPVLQSTVNDDKLKDNNFNKVNKGFTYFVVKHPEKENVAAIARHPVTSKIVKANPRSLLKSSYLYYDQKKENEKPAVQKVEKKIVKNKEAMQAKFLHNFIAKTTIPHAPVRQQRLPRKQTIKPVERADEEIIVQEVVVSSNGIIETSEDGIVKSKVPLKPTEIVQLSDSDDEYNPKKEHKRKKKQKKRKSKVAEIVISDSEEDASDDNVVRVDLSDDSDEEHNNTIKKDQQSGETTANRSRRNSRKSSIAPTERKVEEQEQSSDGSPPQNTGTKNDMGLKKKRGRPPKRRNSTNSNSLVTTGSTASAKKQRRNTKDSLESNESNDNKSEEPSAVEAEIQNIKTKWKCMKCPKTFPSQGSLKTHMQYHNFHEPNSRNLRPCTSKQPDAAPKKPENTNVTVNKYKCSKCGETFKNNILLTRHVKAHETAPKSVECSICQKLFADRAQLINHKRTHLKEQMFKTTTLPKHSPKNTTATKGKLAQSPKKSGNLQCNICGKVFKTLSLLNTHTRTHKRFNCSTCTASFISKLALEDHIRHNCVKQSKSPVRRLSLKIRKSFIVSPQRTSKRIWQRKSVRKSIISSMDTSSSPKEKKKFSATFTTRKAVFTHKVIKRRLETPEKSLLTNSARKTSHKKLGAHSGVPASNKLRSAYINLRTKLDL